MLKGAAIAALLVLPAGCTYDYLQRSDKVAYSSGDAVKANIERQTIDPARDSSTSTKGLGKNGSVMDPEGTAPTP